MKNTELTHSAQVRIIVGDEQGIIRSFDLKSSTDFSQGKFLINQSGDVDPDRAITKLTQLNVQDSKLLCTGRRDGSLEVCCTEGFRPLARWIPENSNKYPVFIRQCSQSMEQDASRILSSFDSGQICIFRFQKKFMKTLCDNNENRKTSKLKIVLNVEVAEQISAADACMENSTVVFGGDDVNLSLCDLSSQQLTFQSKPPRNLYGLMKRNWITSCCFLPHSNGNLLASGTAEHELCLYDIRSSKRPVFVLENWRNARVTCMVPEDNGQSLWVSNAMGYVERFDMKTRCIRGSLRGQVTGSIRDLKLFEVGDKPLIATVGLDRMLRLYSTDTKKLLLKHYCKYELNALEALHLPSDDEEDKINPTKRRKVA